MIWKRGVFVLVLVICLFVFAMHATAQSQPSCTMAYQFCALCGDPPIPGATCYIEITILSICVVPTCPPAAGPYEWCPKCNKYVPVPSAGSPINLSTGNTYIEQSDLRVPGLGGGLTLVRTWNSRWPSTQSAFKVGMFGPNWRSTYEERVFLGSDNYMKYSRGDGSFWSFAYLGPSAGFVSVAPPRGASGATISMAQAPTTWTITFTDGEKRVFDNTSGSLSTIIDRNGNTTQLTYDGLNRLVTVTDPASRHLTFTYQSPTSHLVIGVSSDVGITLSYAYDAQNRLSLVTNQDSTTLTFAYDSNSLITSVKDSDGKVLESHSYDGGARGLTSSRALGVEAVTTNYPNP